MTGSAPVGDAVRPRPPISFELFPPRTDAAALALGRTIDRLAEVDPAFISVTFGAGVAEVLEAIGRMLPDPAIEIDLLVPYDRGDIVSGLHETGRVLSVEYVEDGTRIRALASPEQAAHLAEFTAAPVPA